MSASVWEPGSNIINIDAESTNLSQVFSATAAQVTFTLTLFTYTVGAASIAVYRGGQRLIKGVDWSEVDSTHFSITGISLDAGEIIECVAILGSSSANAIAASASASAASASQVAAGISETNAAASAAASAASADSAAAATSPWALEGGGIHYDGGSVRIGASGARITGDFSNAAFANRVMFQTSTVNSATVIGVLPNGTGNESDINLYAGNIPANTNFATIGANTTAAYLSADKTGTGSYVPLLFQTGGSERMRIDTSGNLLMATTGRLQFSAAGYSIGASSGLQIDAADFTRITIAGVEKFRFGASGQLGIGGATYGTAGQILTSGGPSAAPTWSNAASGGISPSYFTTPSTISNSNVQSMAHGLGAKPNHITINLLVTNANNGWSVGDLISGPGISVSGTANTVIQVGADATNIIVGCGIGSLAVLNKITGAVAAVAVSNFKVYVGVSL